MVGHPERDPVRYRGVGEVVGETFGEARAVPLAVDPVGIAAVTATDVDVCAEQRVDLKGEGAFCRGEFDHGVLGVPRAGLVGDVHPWPAQLFDAAIGPDSGGVVEDAEAVGLLLDDHNDREVVEPQRDIEPMEAWVLVGRFAGGFGLTNRANAPRSVTGPDPGGGIDRVVVAIDGECSLPRPHLREAAGVEDRLASNAHDVGGLVDRCE